MKNLVVLTGAGISEESGIKTFRDQDGLWENYNVMDVATWEGWIRNRNLVLQFYNDRRRQLQNVLPNEGHKGLVKLEKYFNVSIITQNVDNLHERAGSKNILHLHGELTKARSEEYPDYITDIGYNDIHPGIFVLVEPSYVPMLYGLVKWCQPFPKPPGWFRKPIYL